MVSVRLTEKGVADSLVVMCTNPFSSQERQHFPEFSPMFNKTPSSCEVRHRALQSLLYSVYINRRMARTCTVLYEYIQHHSVKFMSK